MNRGKKFCNNVCVYFSVFSNASYIAFRTMHILVIMSPRPGTYIAIKDLCFIIIWRNRHFAHLYEMHISGNTLKLSKTGRYHQTGIHWGNILDWAEFGCQVAVHSFAVNEKMHDISWKIDKRFFDNKKICNKMYLQNTHFLTIESLRFCTSAWDVSWCNCTDARSLMSAKLSSVRRKYDFAFRAPKSRGRECATWWYFP